MAPHGMRVATVALVVGILSAALVATASASSSIRPAPGAPDPRNMVLTVADLGAGARVTKQHYYKDTDFPSVISYAREFDSGRVGSTAFLHLESDAEIGLSVQSTTSFLRSVKLVFSSKATRAKLAKELAREAGGDGLVSIAGIGRPRSLGAGAPGSFDLVIRFRLLGLRTDFHIAVFRVERVLGSVLALGEPGKTVPLSAIRHLANVSATRMSSELGPKNTALPTIAGTPQSGQTLTADPGTWTGAPATFAYQWQRCDPSGANCADISGASGQSYVLTDGDVGSTIRVVVTAGNVAGTASAASMPTPVVTAVGAPTSTSPPTISGTAQVGQTLSASTGAWSGSPTSFSFQWQRCSSAGSSCVDIVGATAGTYLLGNADRGSTIRVVVIASNSVGAGTAISAPTSVVA